MCNPGSHAPTASSSQCVLCTAGFYQDAFNATACKQCRTGSFCPDGASMELTATCMPGTYANSTDADGVPDCFECEIGRFCPGGAMPMRNCSAGSFADQPRMHECPRCEAGTFQELEGMTACDQCLPARAPPTGSNTSKTSRPLLP